MPDNTNKNTTRNSLLRWAVFAVTAIVIAYFVPGSDGRRFTYEVNRPWAYSLLTAPFDIPVHLDSVRSREVCDSLEASFEPVFRRDNEVATTAVSLFSTRLNVARDLGLTAAERAALV